MKKKITAGPCLTRKRFSFTRNHSHGSPEGTVIVDQARRGPQRATPTAADLYSHTRRCRSHITEPLWHPGVNSCVCLGRSYAVRSRDCTTMAYVFDSGGVLLQRVFVSTTADHESWLEYTIRMRD
ncbi:hypothetical protein MRX96_056115 [Rhipicephalus microplus]